jgi:hypothetical protein
MANIPQLRELIIRRLSGGDPSSDSQLDPREIDKYIIQAMNAAIKIEYYTNIKVDGSHGISNQYLVSYVLDVLTDAIRKEEYVVLTQPFISLPNDKGINEVEPLNGRCKTFIPTKGGSFALYRGTPAGNLEGQTGFYVEGQKLFFLKAIKCQGTSKVRVTQVGAVDEDSIIDPALEDSIIRSVLEIMIPRMPQDRIANNVDENGFTASNG